ncbi:8-oxo-dGTP diphosphatase [Melghirimyces algeriensis]|uniref:8-oxo-dGTP diphosphatase n=1 Tax=Melghirimyces algeriensis TaxID=910412 RepID=A0A521D0Y3_9BACL|nr:8-oxo-dGTP diphosphatase [Melghirimyces algeriensis]SMO65338.1 8-oxo-dGTP diphosphatase [Melghirimyces algeriensis]
MQRVANCILTSNGKVLLLKKPRRGWWVAPGGKVEPSETVLEAVSREYEEETGLILDQPTLCGVFTMCMEEEGRLQKEWMLFTFRANHYQGDLLEYSEEGELMWQNEDDIADLSLSEMDRVILTRLLEGRELIIGRLVYNSDEELLYHNLP